MNGGGERNESWEHPSEAIVMMWEGSLQRKLTKTHHENQEVLSLGNPHKEKLKRERLVSCANHHQKVMSRSIRIEEMS